MIVITNTVLFALLGLASSKVTAQTLTTSLPSVDPITEAAIFHVAGNSTQVPTDIVFTSPTADSVWYAVSKVNVTWTGTTPSRFAFQIINTDTSVRASGISLRASVDTDKGNIRTRVGVMESGKYFVRAYDPTDISKQIALSATFTVKPKEEDPTRSKTGIAPLPISGSNPSDVTTTSSSDNTTPVSGSNPSENGSKTGGSTDNTASNIDNKKLSTSTSVSSAASLNVLQALTTMSLVGLLTLAVVL